MDPFDTEQTKLLNSTAPRDHYLSPTRGAETGTSQIPSNTIVPMLTASWEGDTFHHLVSWKRKLKQREKKGRFSKAKAKISVKTRSQVKGRCSTGQPSSGIQHWAMLGEERGPSKGRSRLRGCLPT